MKIHEMEKQIEMAKTRWWEQFSSFFVDLGEMMYLIEKRANLEDSIKQIRSKYIKKGRPYGWRKDQQRIA
jgi:hypothetical protein